MDEVKFETGMMKKIVAKLIQKSIRKKYGYDVRINLESFNATVIDGKAHVILSAEAELDAAALPVIFGVDI